LKFSHIYWVFLSSKIRFSFINFFSIDVYHFYHIRSFGAKMVGGQVNKTASIEGLEIYCTTSKGDIDSMGSDDAVDSKSWCSARNGGNEFDYLLQPLNVSVSLGV
jgi:hypothetical protein